MMHAKRVLACLVLVSLGVALPACSLNPLSLGRATTSPSQIGSSSTTGAPSASATTSPSPGAASKQIAGAAPAHTKFAASPAPKTFDVLLAAGKWGYHSRSKFETKRKSGVTHALHVDMEQDEVDDLTAEQSRRLRDIFKDSKKVHRAIDAAGGDSSDATYTVVQISASDDVGVDTPWVSATLRAGFATSDGQKTLEVQVYRQRTRYGLDNRPFVSGASVGYALSDGSIHNPSRVRL